MAKQPTLTRIRRKEKKNVTNAVVHVNSSFNNTVVTITDIGRPRKGDIAYAASAGKFKGYVSTTATQAWENLN